MKKLEVYISEKIPCLIFDKESDAENFDNILQEYLTSEEARKEFEEAENQYASYGAIVYKIKTEEFIDYLCGEASENLIMACDSVSAIFFGSEIALACIGNIYSIVMFYILEKFHPNINFHNL